MLQCYCYVAVPSNGCLRAHRAPSSWPQLRQPGNSTSVACFSTAVGSIEQWFYPLCSMRVHGSGSLFYLPLSGIRACHEFRPTLSMHQLRLLLTFLLLANANFSNAQRVSATAPPNWTSWADVDVAWSHPSPLPSDWVGAFLPAWNATYLQASHCKFRRLAGGPL